VGIAFLPALYAKSEIRDEKELRLADVEGIKRSAQTRIGLA
jgi:hypothetical protein